MALRNYIEDPQAQRRTQALEMRRAGQDTDHIARKLGYPTIASCEQDLNRAYTKVLKISKEEAKALDLLRLDRMILSLWPDARDGSVTAIDRVIKLIDMRTKMYGNYAPVQVEQITLDAIENEIRELEKQVGSSARKAVRRSRRTPNASTQEDDQQPSQ